MTKTADKHNNKYENKHENKCGNKCGTETETETKMTKKCDNKCETESTKKETESTKKSSSGKGKKFIVSFKEKDGHPWTDYNNKYESIHINGKNGPVLHLYRDSVYFFCVEQDLVEGEDAKHAFILTNSPIGGHNAKMIKGGFAPVSKGCVCFKVDEQTPRYFFYQDYKNESAGGTILVHDK